MSSKEKVNHFNNSYISSRVIRLHEKKITTITLKRPTTLYRKNGKRKENNFTTNTDFVPEPQKYIKKIKKKN